MSHKRNNPITTNEQLNVLVNKLVSELVLILYKQLLVLNYGFLFSFKNVLPSSALLARKFTFHNAAFIAHACNAISRLTDANFS